MRDAQRRDPLPYYPWHVKDYRANRKVQRMSYLERGLYRELLDECWTEGAIPDDLAALADICGCPFDVMADAWAKIRPCFAEHPDNPALLINLRVEDVREGIEDKRAKASRAGKLSAARKTPEMATTVERPSTTVERPLASVSERQPIKEKESKGKESKELQTTTTAIRQTADESPDGVKSVNDVSNDVKLSRLDAGQTPASWVGRLGDFWLTNVGTIQYGRVGKDLQPMVRLWGEDVVASAMANFAKHRRLSVDRGLNGKRPDGWADFVREFREYVPGNAVPLASRAAK